MNGYSARLAELGRMDRTDLMAAYFRNLADTRPPGKRGRPVGCGGDGSAIGGMSWESLASAVLRQEAAANKDGAP